MMQTIILYVLLLLWDAWIGVGDYEEKREIDPKPRSYDEEVPETGAGPRSPESHFAILLTGPGVSNTQSVCFHSLLPVPRAAYVQQPWSLSS